MHPSGPMRWYNSRKSTRSWKKGDLPRQLRGVVVDSQAQPRRVVTRFASTGTSSTDRVRVSDPLS